MRKRDKNHWQRYYRMRTYSTESIRARLASATAREKKDPDAISPGYIRELEIILGRRLLLDPNPVIRVFTIPSDRIKRSFTG